MPETVLEKVEPALPSPEAVADERRRLRRLRFVSELVAQTLATDPDLDLGEAWRLVDSCKNVALRLFPDAEREFDLLIRGRLVRIITERFAVGPPN